MFAFFCFYFHFNEGLVLVLVKYNNTDIECPHKSGHFGLCNITVDVLCFFFKCLKCISYVLQCELLRHGSFYDRLTKQAQECIQFSRSTSQVPSRLL